MKGQKLPEETLLKSKAEVPMGKSGAQVFQAPACIMFTNIPLTKATWPSLKSRERTAKLHGKRYGPKER